MRHAKNLLRTLEQARHDVGLPRGFHHVITLAARIALWEGFLPHWTAWMRIAAPDVSLRLEIGFDSDMIQSLTEGTVDIGLMYTPTARAGLLAEPLFTETLVLVTSDLKRGWPDADYVHIDWGPEFHAQFSDHYSDFASPALVANVGWLGIQQLLTFGGSGYFPLRLVRRHITAGQLWRVPKAPQFNLPAFMVFPREGISSSLKNALDGLRTLAREEQTRN